jgi:hypothetical protein
MTAQKYLGNSPLTGNNPASCRAKNDLTPELIGRKYKFEY